MNLTSLNLFKLAARKMDWLAQRQEVLAENVANVDTPKYKPYDLKPFDFKTALAQTHHLQLNQTNGAHLSSRRDESGPGKVEKDRHSYETKPDGNAVVIEEQMIKVSGTTQDFNLITNLYKKHVGLIRQALSRGS
ncbi:Flagellar basal body rod protein FlgB [uncultured Gammaproteobacteria bacterium]